MLKGCVITYMFIALSRIYKKRLNDKTYYSDSWRKEAIQIWCPWGWIFKKEAIFVKICDYSCYQKEDLNRSSVHEGKKPFKCDICNKTFGNESFITSVTQKNVPSAVVYYYCAWYVFLRDRRYVRFVRKYLH